VAPWACLKLSGFQKAKVIRKIEKRGIVLTEKGEKVNIGSLFSHEPGNALPEAPQSPFANRVSCSLGPIFDGQGLWGDDILGFQTYPSNHFGKAAIQ